LLSAEEKAQRSATSTMTRALPANYEDTALVSRLPSRRDDDRGDHDPQDE
jgi:hypothetical protein